MKRSMKKGSSARDLRASPVNEKGTRKGDKQDVEMVYRQSALHAIDDAPEPAEGSTIDRHAVSAADLLNSSLNINNMDNSSNHHSRLAPGSGSQHERNHHQGSASFILQGSVNSLLKKDVTPTVTHVRKNSVSSVPSPPTGTHVRKNTAGSTVSVPSLRGGGDHSNSSSGGRDLVMKRSIYAPREMMEQGGATLETNLSSSKRQEEETKQEDGKSESSDSYDANALGNRLDTSETNNFLSNKNSNNGAMLLRHMSSISIGGDRDKHGSIANFSFNSDDLDDDDDLPGSVTSYEDYDGPMVCCGFQLHCCGYQPRLCKRLSISIHRVASAVVRFAPCFWCFPIPVSATDRTVLTRLNIISAFLTMGQVIACSWLVVVMLLPGSSVPGDDRSITHGMAPNLWSLHGSMFSVGFFAAVLFISNLVTLKVIQVVNLVGAIRYLWVLLYIIPFHIFFVAGLFDFYDVTYVWVKHWWLVPSLAWFRETYCAPGTATSLCLVPVLGEVGETAWCLENYQATNCTEIRDAAQTEVTDLMSFYYNANVAWGFVLIAILFLIVNTLERIISKPMVQKSRESNVPAWLSLPFLGCSVVGAVFRYSPSSVLNHKSGSAYSWVGTAYLACAVLFLISAALGWFISAFSILSSRDKRYKHLSVILFIVLMSITSFILTVIFVASISYSVALVDIPIDKEQKGEIACGVDTADSCSNCDGEYENLPICPEWSLDDVTRVLQTQTKGSATLAVIFFLYSFSALRFGFVLRKHVVMYQIDYV